jgi:spore coat protein A, manganese oxidase
MTSRRQFLQLSAAVGGGAFIRWQLNPASGSLFRAARALASTSRTQTPLPARNIPRFADPLPTLVRNRGTSLQVSMVEHDQQILPSGLALPATRVWAYQVGGAANYPSNTIEALRGAPTTVTYTNALPTSPDLQNYLSVDQTLHWADPLGQMGDLAAYKGTPPLVVHLHGAEVPSAFDGVPEAWFTPDGKHGKAYSTSVYQYPNTQPPTMLWFHDHALGMTRLNVYSGLAGAYLLRDKFDTGAVNNPLGLPAGAQEIELILQDRQFDTKGQLYFPDGSETDPTSVLNGDPPNPGIHPFWIPEYFGDAIVVNGRTWPYFDVEPRRYRFRIVNGSNARFFRMTLASSRKDDPNNAVFGSGPDIWQIGTDGGLLDRPVRLANSKSALPLFLAPGERADIIVDFTGRDGATYILTNDAPYPYPDGAAPSFSNGDPDSRVMQFRVTKALSGRDTTFNPAAPGAQLRGGKSQPPAIIRLGNPSTGQLAAGVKANVTRQLVLVEIAGTDASGNETGPIEVLLNNTKWNGLREGTTQVAGGTTTQDPQGNWVTELPQLGATEVWEILNLTGDAHPIHLHLIQFQLLNRQPVTIAASGDPVYRATWDSKFPGGKYVGMQSDGVHWGPKTYQPGEFIPGYGPPLAYAQRNADGAIGGNPAFSPFLTGQVQVPDPNEAGWKDTIKVYPGMVTRIVARWTPQETGVAQAAPGTNAFAFDPTQGPGYVWHCHILDHEDSEMMRPLKPTH